MAHAIIAKRCPRCNKAKPATEFARNAAKRDGLASCCKRCASAWQKKYQQTPRGRETHLRSVRNWHKSEAGVRTRRAYLERSRDVRAARRRAWLKTPAGKAAARRIRLRTLYGLSEAGFEALMAMQGHACGICRTKDPKGRYGKLNVDHDHKTGKVRGLLCDKCNRGIAMFGDDLEGLMRAVKYLKK